jgi:hypothetical protein
MHVVLATIRIDPTRADDAMDLLQGYSVPTIRQGGGFVRGTWFRSSDWSRGHSVLVYETEHDAKDAASRAAQGPPPGAPIEFQSADVYELVAEA